MRTKKALKQLNKASALIGSVAIRYTQGASNLKDLLDNAGTLLDRARNTLNAGSSQHTSRAAKGGGTESAAPSAVPPFMGNKTDYVRRVIEARGHLGATPKEVDEAFEAHKVSRSRNLIYNVLGTLVAQGKITKRDGRYFAGAGGPQKQAAAPKKRRISPEGIARIREANRLRWARERAAKRAPAKAASAKRSARKRAASA